MGTPRRRTKQKVEAESKLAGWARNILLVLGGAILGFATNYWISYRTDYRSALNSQLEAFSELNMSVSDHLHTFFEIAEGTKLKTPGDVEALRKSLYDSVTEAQSLANRIGAEEALAAYQVASVELQNASRKVTGPLDAKPLMEAASDYLLAEKQLREAAIGSYKSLL